MARVGRKALVKVSGAAVVFTDEATTANGARTQYQITDAAKRVWDREAAITVETSPDGVTWTVVTTGFTVNRLTGTIVFAVAQALGTQVRVDGKYLPMSTAAQAKEYDYSLSGENGDVSAFQDSWIKREQQRLEASGSLSKWKLADKIYEDVLMAGDPVVIELYSDSSLTYDLKAWALLNTTDVEASADAPIEQSLEWESTTDADKRSVSVV